MSFEYLLEWNDCSAAGCSHNQRWLDERWQDGRGEHIAEEMESGGKGYVATMKMGGIAKIEAV